MYSSDETQHPKTFSHFDMHITNVGNIATMVIRIAMYIEQGLF